MNIFGHEFLESLKDSIILIVQNAVKVLVENSKEDQRYLNKKQAIRYVGGMNSQDFDLLPKMGLKVIYLERPNGKTSVRYDKQEIDVFMAKYKF
ncbi:hypothetical protein [Enterococcus avium]|uniref:hypothetical protein n=1 Tax=Enterococcus avium TaxID=33945 RepID=UPI001F565066|nr:hypothetical protein [Enterococcus avium]